MIDIIWDLDDDPAGNVAHIAEHGLCPSEVEDVLSDLGNATTASESSGQPISFGWTSTGKYIAVVWERVDKDPLVIYPITAYCIPVPRVRRKPR